MNRINGMACAELNLFIIISVDNNRPYDFIYII